MRMAAEYEIDRQFGVFGHPVVSVPEQDLERVRRGVVHFLRKLVGTEHVGIGQRIFNSAEKYPVLAAAYRQIFIA